MNTGGTSTAPVPPCLGNPLPMPTDGFVSAASNGCGITGTWYVASDGAGTTVASPAANVTPVLQGGGRACMTGSTIVDSTFAAWGAVIGLDFNHATGDAQAYDANAAGIGGFEVTFTGNFTQQGLRVNFKKTVLGSNEAWPFVPIARPGTYRIRFADAFVPDTWSQSDHGMGVDATQVSGFEVDVVGGSVASNFDFCVESVIPLPINDDGSLGNKPVTFVPLTLDSTAIVTASSNGAGIQGNYFCGSPTGFSVTCGMSATSGSNPYRSPAGMCASGNMTTSTDNWGAVVGLFLNVAPGTSTLSPYDATVDKT